MFLLLYLVSLMVLHLSLLVLLFPLLLFFTLFYLLLLHFLPLLLLLLLLLLQFHSSLFCGHAVGKVTGESCSQQVTRQKASPQLPEPDLLLPSCVLLESSTKMIK